MVWQSYVVLPTLCTTNSKLLKAVIKSDRFYCLSSQFNSSRNWKWTS